MKFIFRLFSCLVFILVVFLRVASSEEQPIDIDIEVFQALRVGVKGTAFDNENVRIGLPFPLGMLRERNGTPLIEAKGKEFQSRVLKRWPDGSVKWAVVNFLASPEKDHSETVRLVRGEGESHGPPLAVEKDGRIAIDTGQMQAEIRKIGFNIFDKVVVNGRELIQSGTSRGIVLVDGEGREFLAAACKSTRVSIEENGPILATIRIDGAHCSDRTQLLEYTMRLFFQKAKSRVKVQYTLRNASKNMPKHLFIKSLRLDTKINLQDKKQVVVSTHKGKKELALDKGNVGFYQAVSNFPWLNGGDSFYYHGPIPPDYSRESNGGYKQEGYWIWQDGKLQFEGKLGEFSDVGFIEIADKSGQGVSVGIRYMAGQWPKALKAEQSGTVTASLWPEENNVGYWIRYGSHTSYDVMYDFHTVSVADPTDEMTRFQYPLMARAPVAWYNTNVEGIYPLYHFIKFSDEKNLADKLGIKYEVGWRKPKFKVWRYYYWGLGGFLNQHDFARIALVNSIRDDRSLLKAGESYLQAEAMFNYYADWSVYHSDDYDYSKLRFDPKENKKDADLAKVVFEWEHQHWYGMPLWYYMTGDERVKEAVVDWGECIKNLANPLSLTYMRVFGTGMFSLAAMYEFTGDEEYLRLADKNFSNLLNAKFNPKNPYANIFIDWERGYVAGGSGSGWEEGKPGVKADLMLGSLLYDGILNYYLFSQKGNPLKEPAEKLLSKISDFMLREAYFEGTKNKQWAFWIPYVYDLTNREKSRHSYKLVGQASFWTVFPYEISRDERWVEQMKKMMKMALWDEDGVWGSYGYLDHPGFQTIGYYLLNDIGKPKKKPVSKDPTP